MFESLQGAMRLDWLLQRWEVKGLPKVVHPYNANGEQQIFRAKSNQRKQKTASKAYEKSFLKEGIVTGGVTGVMWLKCNPGNIGPFWAITWGTRICDTFYPLAKKYPHNAFVVYAIKHGFKCILLDADMDPRHEDWMKTYHNRFHAGSEITFDEILNDACELRAMWVVHAGSIGLCERSDADSDGYLTKQWNHIKDHVKATHFQGSQNKFLKAIQKQYIYKQNSKAKQIIKTRRIYE